MAIISHIINLSYGNYTLKKNIDWLSKYQRPQYATYLTAPEWRNVEMAEEYAQLLNEKKSFFMFPHFSQIYTYWHVFNKSYLAAREYNTRSEIIFSEYMMMNLFIGVMSTVEYSWKGLISVLLWPLFNSINDTDTQKELAQVHTDYKNFIQHTPFYKYTYLAEIKKLWSTYWGSANKTVVDALSLCIFIPDLAIKALISTLVNLLYSQEGFVAEEATGINVDVRQISDEKIDELELLTDQDESEKKYYYFGKRYKKFVDEIRNIAKNQLGIVEISGQKQIQVKCTTEEAGVVISEVTNDDCKHLYTYRNFINTKLVFFTLDVKVNKLIETIQKLDEKNVGISLVHDF